MPNCLVSCHWSSPFRLTRAGIYSRVLEYFLIVFFNRNTKEINKKVLHKVCKCPLHNYEENPSLVNCRARKRMPYKFSVEHFVLCSQWASPTCIVWIARRYEEIEAQISKHCRGQVSDFEAFKGDENAAGSLTKTSPFFKYTSSKGEHSLSGFPYWICRSKRKVACLRK